MILGSCTDTYTVYIYMLHMLSEENIHAHISNAFSFQNIARTASETTKHGRAVLPVWLFLFLCVSTFDTVAVNHKLDLTWSYMLYMIIAIDIGYLIFFLNQIIFLILIHPVPACLGATGPMHQWRLRGAPRGWARHYLGQPLLWRRQQLAVFVGLLFFVRNWRTGWFWLCSE